MSRQGIEDTCNPEISAQNKEGKVGEESEAYPVLIPSTSVVRRTLREEIGRVSPGGLVKVKPTAALLFRSIHSRVGMLQ